jgi:hypothetical protein
MGLRFVIVAALQCLDLLLFLFNYWLHDESEPQVRVIQQVRKTALQSLCLR